ncbi:hypothetical protein VCHA34P126_40209 [Vibrio chagasii]|nr:hypothetical protein VCHA30O60_10243 [Vibrio chagasii]CAH6976843.1 hypothetical protein VCHA34P126_40209 [Vibrio chagasii]CAH7088813.1 hypothetical protein VCHA48P434_10369 [Vibrio chagasii]CAH7190236.1 hypothetical protein VCHA42P256_30033 [Vibrio chagasii]CAH7222828.1 hypothetical protein VCHA43P272_30033 [Vibrio chagasii]
MDIQSVGAKSQQYIFLFGLSSLEQVEQSELGRTTESTFNINIYLEKWSHHSRLFLNCLG